MFVPVGCGYVIVQGQTLYGGMIYRPLYEVCPPNLFYDWIYWVDSEDRLGKRG